MIALLLNHLWQSSLCVAAAGLLALALHRNGAHARFWLWFAASTKFLVPFAALTAISAHFLTPVLPPVPAPAVISMAPLAQPFSAVSLAAAPVTPASVSIASPAVPAPPRTTVPAAVHLDLGSVLLALWFAGSLVIALRWLVRWSRVRALLRQAVPVPVDAPIAVKFSSSRLEPGLVGILKPVILLPQGIEQQLSAVELKAVLAHELCHWRRHDNLLAAVHMLVEAVFWFFPLVWWLGARLNAERERACDESVLADGNDPQMYAEGILKVCRAYLQSPVACVAGVSGGGLKKRIDAIMENRLILQLNAARKFVLGTSAAAALIVPLLLGLAAVPVVQRQAKAAATPLLNALRSAPAMTSPALNEPSRVTSRETTPQNEAKSENLTPPSLDLSGALAGVTLATPVLVASNVMPNDRPAAPVQSAAPDASGGLRPKTEAGIRCLLGLGPDGCENVFENPSLARRAIRYCAGNNWYVGEDGGGCGARGPLESIEHLGATAVGNDVYSVKFLRQMDTYLLPPPGPDGKIMTHCEFDGPPADARRVGCLGGGVALSAKVTSPADQARILYTRSAETSAAPSAAAIETTLMPGTPSGEGDPNSIVCRAPQLIAGSGQFGPPVCLHNHEWWRIAMNGKDVGSDGKTLIDRPTVSHPKGDGDPDAITCRTPQFRMRGPLVPVCRTNRFWADLIKNNQIADANGVVVTRRPSSPDFGSIDSGNVNFGGSVIRDSAGNAIDSGQPAQSSASGH